MNVSKLSRCLCVNGSLFITPLDMHARRKPVTLITQDFKTVRGS